MPTERDDVENSREAIDQQHSLYARNVCIGCSTFVVDNLKLAQTAIYYDSANVISRKKKREGFVQFSSVESICVSSADGGLNFFPSPLFRRSPL